MKKVCFPNSRKQKLVGSLYLASSGPIIIMSHGFTKDKSEWGKFHKLGQKLNNLGYNVLSFDFSGCGESPDDSLTIEKQVDDLNSAIAFVKKKGYKKIALLGYSLGALISLKAYRPEIKTLVLWAPLTDKLKYNWKKNYTQKQLKDLRKKSFFIKKLKRGPRKKIIVEQKMFKDLKTLEQKEVLKKIKCPTLIIHGQKDKSIPYTDSKKAIKILPTGSELKLLKEANHGFYKNLDKTINLTQKWFLKHL